jgi:hypothetical protein
VPPLQQGPRRHERQRERRPLPLLRLHRRQKYGRKAFDGERLPRQKLEEAVLHQLAWLYPEQRLVGDALVKATAEAERRGGPRSSSASPISGEQARRAGARALRRSLRARQALTGTLRSSAHPASGAARRPPRPGSRTFVRSAPPGRTRAPAADLAAVVDYLYQVIADAEPQKAKALLRVPIEDLRVNGRREILPTYRLVTPEVCASGLFPLRPSCGIA